MVSISLLTLSSLMVEVNNNHMVWVIQISTCNNIRIPISIQIFDILQILDKLLISSRNHNKENRMVVISSVITLNSKNSKSIFRCTIRVKTSLNSSNLKDKEMKRYSRAVFQLKTLINHSILNVAFQPKILSVTNLNQDNSNKECLG